MPKSSFPTRWTPKAAEIFRARGIEVDEIIGNDDGPVIRSSNKAA